MAKAIALLSGGLDSTLAIKLILQQGIDVHALNFTSPFCNCTPRKSGCVHQASLVSRELGIPIKVLSKGEEYLEIVKHPRFGYGKNLNPCIDCRIFILKKAKEYMDEIGGSFIITGEVLGQRPMSQRRDTLNIIERESNLRGLILRPLSAKHFKPTIPEETGIVDREKLLAIQGRSRKEQLSLAESLAIKGYGCPAGGCLLTDLEFSRRVRDLMEHNPHFSLNDIHLLKVGRHFRLSPETKLIVGRNDDENRRILTLPQEGDMVFNVEDFPGPVTLLQGKKGLKEIRMSAAITVRYSKARGEENATVSYRGLPGGEKEILLVSRKERIQAEEFLKTDGG